MKDKFLRCKICDGILYVSSGKIEHKEFYEERLKCLTCGRFYLKEEIDERED